MTKKIIIVYSGAKHQGGIEKYLSNLFRFYDKKKMQLILVSLGSWPLCEEIKKARGRIVVLSGGRVAPQNILKIKEVASKEKVSLIVSQGIVANAYARSAAVLANVPHLATVHSDFDLDYTNPVIRSIYGTSDKIVRWKTDKYIAVSKYLKKQLVKSGIKGNKIVVIYNGVRALKVKETIKEDEIIIGSMGRLHEIKGYEGLIKAFSMVNPIGLKLIIWGEGKERVKLEDLIKTLGLEGKVELPGFIDNKDALAKTDIYIQSSLSEGFGLGVVEAMLAEKPVIVTPVGSLPEIVQSGKNGLVTKDTSPKSIAGAIERILTETELLDSMRQKAVKDAEERYAVDKWIEETERVYMETAK